MAPLKRAQFSLQAGHLYGALDDLGQAWIFVSGHDEVLRNPAIAKEGMKAFEKEWERVDAVLKRQELTYSSYSWANRPAAVLALSQAWFGKTRRLLDGGRGFATATKPEDGIFYLGSAQATAGMAVFCGTLRLPEKGKPRPMRSYLPEIEALDQQVQAAYAPPASIDHHADFIRLSALMKDARELDASLSYGGSLFQYLEATRLYAVITAPATDTLNEEEVRASADSARARIAESAFDDSILQLMVERTQGNLAAAEKKQDALRSTKLTLDRVMPAYYTAMESSGRSPAAVAGNQVTVTLVRWPYT